ncbi:MAG: hypothetical protein P1P88_04670 [Bacteroidales bacterium]|nr:hypothetical protein [Bacteroidales bacterium]
MSIINLLSSSLGVRNDIPNQKLALEIAESENINALEELVENLQSNKDKKIQSDCIKVLYEIGYLKPEIISAYLPVFVKVAGGKNNRLIWGCMIAINCITDIYPDKVYQFLSEIIEVIDKGSVITKDAGVGILAKLATLKEYSEDCFPLLLEQIKFCPDNQLGQYAEKALPCINSENKQGYIAILNSRLLLLEKESQKKRLKKILTIKNAY